MGKLIASLIGLFTAGVPGAIVGFIAGFFFDRGVAGNAMRSPEQRARIEQAFFQAVFPLLGHIAKADGRVSEDEISGTEQLMTKMGLDSQARSRAIELFKKGIEPDFSVDDSIQSFMRDCGKYADLKQMLLIYLISIAFADGQLHQSEESVLAQVAADLGYSRFAFNHLVGMVKAQNHFYRSQQSGGGYQNTYSQAAQADELETAYAALGVKSSVSDAELKRAYRKLMSEHHPDKLAGRGVPDDVVKVATEKAQEIQTAYDLIRKHRKG